jgi:sugar phosphate isomerase/epimerase
MHFKSPSRLRPMRFAALASALAWISVASTFSFRSLGADWTPKVAIQSWSLRSLPFDKALDFAVQHHVQELHLSVHLDPKASREELLAKKAAWEAKGIHVYSFGVADTSLDKEENRKLFECAKLLGIRQIVVEPQDFKIWDNLEELVKEYDIRLAVHNHGIRSLYGNPAVVRAVLKHRDPRIGVCLDVGWVTAAGFDAARVFSEYEGRVFDIHLKDKRVEKVKAGEDVAVDTLIGEGNANLKGLLEKLAAAKWSGVLALETDSPIFAQDPSAFVDSGIAFVKAHTPVAKQP